VTLDARSGTMECMTSHEAVEVPAPSATVRSAFSCDGRAERLAGGEARSWRCGDVVLKPVDDAEQASWIAAVLTRIDTDVVVVPRPVCGRDGSWVVDGWTATRWVDAHSRPGRWQDIIEAGRAFHASMAAVTRPGWMDRADDWWRRADAVAWGEREPEGDPELVELVARLGELRIPVQLPNQVVHGDLCGNVLFDARERPVVIDFSPYWRPLEWASAIVAVDAFEWEGAGPAALSWLGDHRDADQLLVRAAIFRIATSAEVAAVRGADASKLLVHRRTVEAIEARVRD
jgi:uncharacterized protein (TIGR02569 family)